VSGRPADIPGDPGGVVALGGSFTNAAENVAALQAALAGQHPGSWIGLSAGSYAGKLGDFRPHLGGLEGSLRATGGHLNGWSDKLTGYQSKNHGYQQQYDDLASQQSTAANSASTAKAKHDTAANQPRSLDPATHQHQESVLQRLRDTWHSAAKVLSDIESAIGDLVSLAEQLIQDFEHEAADVASAVRNEVHQLEHVIVAASAAVAAMVGSDVVGLIRDGESVVKRIGSDVERGAEEAGELLLHAGESAWKAEIQGLDYTYGAFVRPFLKDAGFALAVLQVGVLCVPVFGEIAEPFVDAANEVDSALLLGGDSLMASQQDLRKSGYDGRLLEKDAVGLGLAIIPGGKDAKAMLKTLKSDGRPLEKLAQIGRGMIPDVKKAKSGLKSADKETKDLGNIWKKDEPLKEKLAQVGKRTVTGKEGASNKKLAKESVKLAGRKAGDAVEERIKDTVKSAFDAPDPSTPPGPTEPFILPLPLPMPPVLVVP
jgi:hypothetical protein